jgi:hypothetical protein
MSRAAESVERRDVDGGKVFLAGLALAALIAVSLLSLRLIYGVTPQPVVFGTAMEALKRAGPVLETDPQADRLAYEAEKRNALNAIGWIDKQAGFAHIPIEDAMRIVAAQGVPDWGQMAALAPENCRLVRLGVPRAPQASRCYPTASGGD